MVGLLRKKLTDTPRCGIGHGETTRNYSAAKMLKHGAQNFRTDVNGCFELKYDSVGNAAAIVEGGTSCITAAGFYCGHFHSSNT